MEIITKHIDFRISNGNNILDGDSESSKLCQMKTHVYQAGAIHASKPIIYNFKSLNSFKMTQNWIRNWKKSFDQLSTPTGDTFPAIWILYVGIIQSCGSFCEISCEGSQNMMSISHAQYTRKQELYIYFHSTKTTFIKAIKPVISHTTQNRMHRRMLNWMSSFSFKYKSSQKINGPSKKKPMNRSWQ